MATALSQEFFRDPGKPHGRVKRIMYKKYLQAFIPVTQSSFNTIIIDGFAGAGRYSKDWPGETDAYGSPLIALMVSLNYFFKKHHKNDVNWATVMAGEQGTSSTNETTSSTNETKSIHLIFIEKDKKNFTALKENIRKVLYAFFQMHGNPVSIETTENECQCTYRITQYGYPLICDILNRSFIEFDPPNVPWGTRCLTFVDPFGYTHTPMAHVLKFCGPYSELLINLMSSYVNRFVSRNPEGVAALFGIETPDIKNDDETTNIVSNIIRGDEEAGGNVQSCAKRYEELLKRKTRTDFSLRFEMRGIGNQIIYHLIFITHHMKGLKEMKESMNRCDQDGGGMIMSDYKVVRLGHALTLGNDQTDTDVADAIFHEFQSRTAVHLKVIRDFVWLETPYVDRAKPLTVLVNDGRITKVTDLSGKKTERKTFPGDSWLMTFRPDDPLQAT